MLFEYDRASFGVFKMFSRRVKRSRIIRLEFAVQSPTRNSSDEPADGRSKRNRGVNSLERLFYYHMTSKFIEISMKTHKTKRNL